MKRMYTEQILTKMFFAFFLTMLLGLSDMACGSADDEDPEDGDVTDGDADEPVDGDDADGDAADGDAADGDAADGDLLDGDGNDGDLADGDVIDGDSDSDGDLADGDSELIDGDSDEEQGAAYWDWCPSVEDYQGGNWNWALDVKEGALYCSRFEEGRSLETEIENKAKLRFISGTFPIPDTAGDYGMRLPVCIKFLEGPNHPLLAEAGDLSIAINEEYGNLDIHLVQPMVDGNQNDWQLDLRVQVPLDEAPSIRLDGVHPLLSFDNDRFISIDLCKGECQNSYQDRRWFDSCSFVNAPLHKHHVTFDGGQVHYDMRVGFSFASTEPGLFVRAHGQLGDTAFEQTDFWKLIYRPQHHHFAADYAVIFDAPISGACGLKTIGLSRWSAGDPPAHMYSINCDLSSIEELSITDQSWEQPESR